MNLSMPNTMAMPGTRRGSTAASVAASVMKPAPVTPEAPLEVSIATPTMMSCCLRSSGMFSACAMNKVASVM